MSFPVIARGIIADMGLRLVEPGPWPSYIPTSQWHADTCMGASDADKVMVIVCARVHVQRGGAFRRLVDRLLQDKWKIVVTQPVWEMVDICLHMGFTPDKIGPIEIMVLEPLKESDG